jgi:hypothetical protein
VLHAYPGTPVRIGDDRRELVRSVQAALESAGAGPLAIDGAFGPRTRSAVVAFQGRHGLSLDGVVGAATWQRLFNRVDGSSPTTPRPFAAQLLKIASAEVGAREAGGANRGPRVDEYLWTVGLDPTRGSYPWCAAFVYYCFARAARLLSLRNPCVRTAGCMDHWRRAPAAARIVIDDVLAAPEVVLPGAIFMVDHGKGRGHTGLVERMGAGMVHTIEGNTDPGGSREGDGVYRRIRALSDINTGFIDYVREPAPPTVLLEG